MTSKNIGYFNYIWSIVIFYTDFFKASTNMLLNHLRWTKRSFCMSVLSILHFEFTTRWNNSCILYLCIFYIIFHHFFCFRSVNPSVRFCSTIVDWNSFYVILVIISLHFFLLLLSYSCIKTYEVVAYSFLTFVHYIIIALHKVKPKRHQSSAAKKCVFASNINRTSLKCCLIVSTAVQ